MKIIIIGGGPAGMIAAISAASNIKNRITLLEKNDILGKKILVTGKGRCNITSSINIDDFIKNIPGNGKFLFSAFKNFTNIDILNLLNSNGVKVKEERGNRYFPVTDQAETVRYALEKEVKKHDNIEVITRAIVSDVLVKNDEVYGVKLENGKEYLGSKIIIATGGKSYSRMGATGDGYKFAEKLGHKIEKIRGSLVPIEAEDICMKMQGLSLKNVKIDMVDISNNKVIYEDFGEMLFTHFGVSGPIILSGSAHLLRYKDVDELLKDNKIKLYIDLKPALSKEELDKRVLRDFDEVKNKEFKNSLDKLLPRKIIEVFIEKTGINPNKSVNEITKEERRRIVELLKKFDITLMGFRDVEEAIVTAGGVSTKEINPKTMESKLIKGLYFAGEVIDVDAYTGGFNLQIAYSTGYTAGLDNE